MATLGLLSPEFPSSSLAENLDAMAAAGAGAVQFDLTFSRGRNLPDPSFRKRASRPSARASLNENSNWPPYPALTI